MHSFFCFFPLAAELRLASAVDGAGKRSALRLMVLVRCLLTIGFGVWLSGCASHSSEVTQPHVRCVVWAIELGADHPFLALPGVHDLQGQAHVRCTNLDRWPRVISVGLLDGAASPLHTLQAEGSEDVAASFYLFSDEERRAPMAHGPLAEPAVKRSFRVEAVSTAEVTVPFYARMAVVRVLPAGRMVKASTLRAWVAVRQ